jgi:hypothetical protein
MLPEGYFADPGRSNGRHLAPSPYDDECGAATAPTVVYPVGQPVGPLAPYHCGEAGAEGCDDGRTG